MRRSPALLLLLPLTLVAPPAAAMNDDPVLRLELAGGYAVFIDNRRYHGILAGAEAGYTFDPFWMIRAGYALGDHASKGLNFRVHQLTAGLRYQLDVFEYVPWLDVSPGLYIATGEHGPTDTDYGFAAGVGFDWLASDAWSVGIGARYHRLFGEEKFPSYFDLGLRVGYRWTLGDPFAP